MTKAEKIQEAYGKTWEVLKDDVDKNGWLEYSSITGQGAEQFLKHHKIETKGSAWKPFWRPLSLQGIENNNGWTKVESPDDLPKEDGNYLVFRHGSLISKENFSVSYPKIWLQLYKVTHYKAIEKIKPPIY